MLHSAISIIKRSQKTNQRFCDIQTTPVFINFLNVLLVGGLISGYTFLFEKKVRVFLRYDKRNFGFLDELLLVSCGSRKIYSKKKFFFKKLGYSLKNFLVSSVFGFSII